VSARRSRGRFATTALLACASWTAVALAHDFWPQPVERSRVLMGTLCTVTAEGVDSTQIASAVERAHDRIAALEMVMSSWRDDSELARFHASGNGFECSPALFGVLATARAMAESTGGAFDPTVGPLLRAWDVRGKGRVPTADERDSARARVDWRSLELDPATRRARFARSGMEVDLGGIGKGAALDEALDTLRAAGAGRALADFGGQLAAIGAWEVTVADPRERLRPLVRLRLDDASLSTSAQMENERQVGGKRYGHILDPRKGAPVEFRGSVSVRARSATEADALSTALLVMGRAGAEAYVAHHPDIGVLWLEPASRGIAAWSWNLDDAQLVAGAHVTWKNGRPNAATNTNPSGRNP
jgi:thiamine biosynthesis lipoprotein